MAVAPADTFEAAEAGRDEAGHDEAGHDAKAALPLAAITHRMFVTVSGRGDGADDGSWVIRAYAALNGGETPIK
jgi:3-hydroxyisobutyrate dehydrogenase-like beta-hydroxyacid dehydrogenase